MKKVIMISVLFVLCACDFTSNSNDGPAATKRFQEEKAAKKAAKQIHIYGPTSGCESLFILTGVHCSTNNVNNETIWSPLFYKQPENMCK